MIRPKERLLRKRIPKEEIRKELERWSDRLGHWNEFATAVVVLGLAIEYLPDAASFLGIFSHAIFAVLREHADPLRQFGGLLVVIGVAGELWTDVRGSKVESDLRDESNTQIAALHGRAAKAEKDAAEANLEAEKLRSQFAWRVLSKEMVRKLTSDLKRKSSACVCVEYMNSDPESLPYAKQFRDVFKLAGWKVWLLGATTQDLVFGIVLSRPELADNAADQFIMETFQQNALDFTTARLPDWGSAIFTPSDPPPDPKAARIFIGPKWPDIEVSK